MSIGAASRRGRGRGPAGRLRATWSAGVSRPVPVLFAVFLLVPILASLVLAFTSFGIGNIQSWTPRSSSALENFAQAVREDELFLKAVRNTAYFVVVGVPLTVALGCCSPRAQPGRSGKLRGLFRVGYYLPVVTSIVAIAVIWRYLLEPDVGLVNRLLG